MSKVLTSLCFVCLSSVLAASTLWANSSQEVTFERPDGATIFGTLHLVDMDDEDDRGELQRPAVLLLHQAQSSRDEFSFLLDDLHGLGFHTLAIDLRGHGKSTGPEVLGRAFFMKLFRDPDFAPPDIEAVLEWLAAHERVDGRRIAAMGGSVGANLSFVANGAGWHVKTAVVLSGNAEAAADLRGNLTPFQPHNVLLLAADDDHGRDDYARQMFELSAEPKQLRIQEGSSAHGATLLKEHPELADLVLEWLAQQLR